MISPRRNSLHARMTEPRPHPWRVLHAAEYARDVLPVIESQLAAGKPALVTAAGTSPESLLRTPADSARAASLLNAWNDVRLWRRALLDSACPAPGPTPPSSSMPTRFPFRNGGGARLPGGGL